MKRRQPDLEPVVLLPSDIAAGPDRWPTLAAWLAAGREWSIVAGRKRDGWRDLLDADVRYWTGSIGNAHYRSLQSARHRSGGPTESDKPNDQQPRPTRPAQRRATPIEP